MFSRPLQSIEVNKLFGCSRAVKGDILYWDTNIWDLNGTAEIVDIPDNILCGEPR